MSAGGAPASDLEAVTELLGREPSCEFEVVVRSRTGSPVVIANGPFTRDGRPMPTRYWLVDPELKTAVSALESVGGVRQASSEVLPEQMERAHAAYAAERDCLIPKDHRGPVPSGGVGGTRRGVKCLHAHVAWWLAGGDDPVGAWAAERLGLSRG